MKLRLGLSIFAAGAALALVGCGDDEGDSATTPQQALTEIGETRKGLDAAIASYASGDADKADEQVGDAYLKHFELVEGPLDEVDHELTEELEDSIREELRDKIKAKAPAAEIETLHHEILANLDKAETALR